MFVAELARVQATSTKVWILANSATSR